MYYGRIIDKHLKEWAQRKEHKPLLLRGARQIGKSTAVRHFAELFDNYVETLVSSHQCHPHVKSIASPD